MKTENASRTRMRHWTAVIASDCIPRTAFHCYHSRMAAVPEAYSPDVVELRDIRSEDLEPLLVEEGLTWRSLLSWDFTPSADLVRRFVNIQALNGFALVAGRRVVGYAYYVCEERK